MLITPEQKPGDSIIASDNHNEPQQMDNKDEIYRGKSTTLDNSNLNEIQDCNGENDLNEDANSHCNTPNISPSLLDIKNCNTQKAYSPRISQRLKAKFPPHINLSTPLKTSPGSIRRALFLGDDTNCDSYQPVSPMSASPTRSSPVLTPGSDNDKQEVISGRLYLIRHTGSISPSPTPSSPSRSQMKCFPFHVSSTVFSSPSSSPPSPSSPTIGNKRKTPVYMRVYKCNMDHFALVSRDSSYSSKHVYLNMRHSRVLPGDCLGRFVIAGHCDSGSLMEFETPDLPSLERWLDALQGGTPPGSPGRHVNVGSNSASSTGNTCSPSIPKSPALPTLTETEEEN